MGWYRSTAPSAMRPRVLAGTAVVTLLMASCGGGRGSTNADGDYEGVVARVWADGLRLDLDSGGDIRVDTWGVCGDETARHIRPGDRITVSASRDLFSRDAWQILDETGEPAC